MQFSIVAVLGALAAVANAKAVITNSGFDVKAGEAFTLKWANATGGVEVQLVTGSEKNLQPVGQPLATGVTDSQFTWTPPSSLASGSYAFKVTDSTNEPNYSLQFTFQGSASASTTAASSTSQSSSSSSVTSTTSTSSSSSATITTTTSANSTSSSTTTTKASTTTTSRSSSTTAPTNTNDSQRFSSSLALVLVTVAALLCFN